MHTWTASSRSVIPSGNTIVTVYRDGLDAGSIVRHAGLGWKFMPRFQARNSRKAWSSPVDSVKGRLPKQAVTAVREVTDFPNR